MSKDKHPKTTIYLSPPVMEGWSFTGWLYSESSKKKSERVIQSAFEMSQKSKASVHHSNLLKADSSELEKSYPVKSSNITKGLIRRLRALTGV